MIVALVVGATVLAGWGGSRHASASRDVGAAGEQAAIAAVQRQNDRLRIFPPRPRTITCRIPTGGAATTGQPRPLRHRGLDARERDADFLHPARPHPGPASNRSLGLRPRRTESDPELPSSRLAAAASADSPLPAHRPDHAGEQQLRGRSSATRTRRTSTRWRAGTGWRPTISASRIRASRTTSPPSAATSSGSRRTTSSTARAPWPGPIRIAPTPPSIRRSRRSRLQTS